MANSKTFHLALTFLLYLLPVTITALSFNGNGIITVLKGDDYSKVAQFERVGCLDEYGQFTSTTSNCAVFHHHDAIGAVGFDGYLSTHKGNCTWWYSTRPKNLDSAYGKGDAAFECGEGKDVMEQNDYVYTLGHNIICTGDRNCFMDAKSIPAAGQTSLTWLFRWGSQQRGITPGHVQVAWKWEQIL